MIPARNLSAAALWAEVRARMRALREHDTADEAGPLDELAGILLELEQNQTNAAGCLRVCPAGLIAEPGQRAAAVSAWRREGTLYHTTVNGLAEGVLLFDDAGQVEMCNPAAERILGLSAAEMTVGRGWLATWQPVRGDGRPCPAEELPVNRCLRHGESVRNVLLGDARPDGRVVWLHVNAEPQVDRATGQVRRVVMSFCDVTESRAAQQFQETLVRGMDAAAVGAAVLADGRLVWMNRALAELLLIPERADFAGKPWFRALHRSGWGPIARRIRAESQLTGNWCGRVEVRRRDGAKFPAQLALRRMDSRHVICVCSDLTAEVAAWEGLAAANARIEATAASLRQTNLRLERMARHKDEFLASMSHELRTPLCAVSGMADVLLEGTHGPLLPRQRRCTQVIADSSQHLLEMINDILDLAKIEAQRMELNCGAVAAGSVSRAALELVASAAHKKRISLGLHLPPEEVRLRADELRLRQILVNLLSNAVKFTPPEGRVSLTVILPADGSEVRFEVSDTGIGIQPEDLPRLFQPFTQLDGGLDREHGGTGLGLTLVRRMTEQHGGYVTVQSTPGLGSCFTVHLPRGEVPAGPPPAAAPAVPAVPAPPDAARPRRVLVVDDNEINLELLADYLAAKGWMVKAARSGAEALELAAACPPDVVLMDIQMPRMSGLEAIGRLRQLPGCQTIPVIAVTALAMVGDHERCLAAGATAYVTKPVKPAAVEAEMKRQLPPARP